MSSHPPEKGLNPSLLPQALSEAWRADVPSTGELRRGYARFLRQQSTRKFAPIARFILVGAVLGAGLAQAATVASKHWLTRELLQPAPQVTAKKPAVAASRAAAEPAPAEPDTTPPTAAAAAQSPSATPAPPVAARQPQLAPSADTEAPYVRQQWQAAAAAIRDHDFVKADSALHEVERSASPAERDAAQLARAQLLASNGRSAEARALATQLQQQAGSAFVRDKARELLTRISENDAGNRSNFPAPAIHQP